LNAKDEEELSRFLTKGVNIAGLDYLAAPITIAKNIWSQKYKANIKRIRMLGGKKAG